VSPNQVFPLESGPQNPIAERVLKDPNLTFDVAADAVVIAVKAELLVRKSTREASLDLDRELSKIARNCGTLASIAKAPPPGDRDRIDDQASADRSQPDEGGPAGDIEIWRLTDPKRNSIDEARRLRVHADDEPVKTGKGPTLLVPAVSPNHVSILSSWPTGCPAGPPHPAPPPPPSEQFVQPPGPRKQAKVVVLDSGYIYTDPAHVTLDRRVTVTAGDWLDTGTIPASWRPDPPDRLDTDADGRLDGIAGHGTFIAGLIAHICPAVEITVVGQRDQELDITGLNPAEQSRLFATEVSIARSILLHCDTDVIQCGFSFPTLDDYPSLPFLAALQVLTGPDAPRQGVAVVAPAGNEASRRRYWPAALPDVIGVASTNRRGNDRAWFSNWGRWCDCCTRGEDVYSTFIYWDGPIEGEPLTDIEHFIGWARWDGTSFAAPKASAAIACLVVKSDRELLPVDAWELLVTGAGGVQVTELMDLSLSGFPGVTLPHLHLR
jgi:hypothetical protein